jgi:predicted XRE-type DNA-binding protein
MKAARKEFQNFPEQARIVCLTALTIAAEGGKADIAKPMKGMGSGVFEIAMQFKGDAFGVIYAVQIADEIWVDTRCQDAAEGARFDPGQIKKTEGDVPVKREKLEVLRGSGNVFRDLGHKNPDVEQLKAILAAEIIKTVDRQRLTVRAAHDGTGFAAADFSRIRNADLDRFTVDRLMLILCGLGARLEIKVRVKA